VTLPRCAALAAACFLLIAAKAPEDRTIHYKLTPLAPGGWGNALRVEMRFRGDADGETTLFLPDEWGGSAALWRHITDLEIRGATRLAGYYAAPIIHHRPGATIRVRYDVVSAWHEEPGFEYEKARPLITPGHFFVHGEGIFAAPGGRQAKNARFRWGRIPKGWRVASDLDHLSGGRTSVANLINSVAIGGRDLQVVERRIGRAPLRVAVTGKWSFTPGELADMVEKVIAAENEYWGEEATPFLVAMAPLGELPSGLSYTGTGRTDAFSIASTSAFELKHATRFLGHEYMHSWVPIALGNMPEDEASDFWFSEGFNDYLASKVLLRAGLWTLEQWAADKNETLLRYGTSPAKTIPAHEVGARFWTDQAVQQVSYDRGHLLAAILDAEIAERTAGAHSIDTVMRAQRTAAEGSSRLASELFRATLLETTGIDAEPLVERHARAGEALALPAGLLGPCGSVVTERRRSFDRGYDAQATRVAGGIIAGVDPQGPAFAAGLRDGMRLIRRESGTVGDAGIPLAYRVADGAEEKVISYLPAGRTEHEVQKIVLSTAGEEQEQACKARLGGERMK
jgi:predicted metalloprotease with PDZ domain